MYYSEFKAKNVVVVVGDQFRNDESFGEPTHKYIPHLWNDLVPNASRCITFYGNPSYMALVHLAIITGSWKDLRRANPDDIPEQPTMFEYYRKALGKDKVLGIHMPESGLTTAADTEDSKAVADWLGIELRTIATLHHCLPK